MGAILSVQGKRQGLVAGGGTVCSQRLEDSTAIWLEGNSEEEVSNLVGGERLCPRSQRREV